MKLLLAAQYGAAAAAEQFALVTTWVSFIGMTIVHQLALTLAERELLLARAVIGLHCLVEVG